MEDLIQQNFDDNLYFQLNENRDCSTKTRKNDKDIPLISKRGKEEDQFQSKFDTQLADAALRQASNAGFLISPNKNLLLEQCQNEDLETSSLKEIRFVHLTNYRIRTLGHIQSCRYLTICILHNNYLTRFSALENCPCLKRLDLHSNQISKLPDEQFWMEMKNLLVLNLHDNGIGKLSSIQPLSNCSKLVALTLYDTPLSLKPSYRHHIVNSIWTLKALDRHVIADDEIIEDASFSTRFRSLNPALHVDLCPKDVDKPLSLELEVEVLNGILSNINRCLRHGSPVVVIQRWIRGHLARKRMGRSYANTIAKLKELSLIPSHSSNDSQGGHGEVLSLDYDTYLKNRRPGSKTPSASTGRRIGTPCNNDNAGLETQSDEADLKLPSQFQINLQKLEEHSRCVYGSDSAPSFTIHVHQDHALPAKSLFANSMKVSVEKEFTGPNFGSLFDAEELPTAILTKKDSVVHQIPGLLPHEKDVEEGKKDVGIQCGNDPEVPNHKWRIHDKKIEVHGEKPSAALLDPMQCHIYSNRDSGRDVREAIEYWHDQEASLPKRKVMKTKSPTRLKDTVSLATLMAVTKAYRDRDRSDNIAIKVDRVMRIQQERMQSRQIVAAFKDEKRIAALGQRQDDRLRVAEAMQQIETNKTAYLEYAQERKQRFSQHHEWCSKEVVFSADFNNQHISVSNALIRHDRQTAKEEVEAEKKEMTHSVKGQLADQARMVKRYMEHKQLVNQLNASKDKARVDARIARDGNERFMKSRQRVAGIKAKKSGTQSYRHSLPTTSEAKLWSTNSPRAGRLEIFNSDFKSLTPTLPPLEDLPRVAGLPTPAVHSAPVPLPPVLSLQASV